MTVLYPGMGQLRVVSKPPGIEIIIDNKETGRLTPVKPFNIMPGDHQITFATNLSKKIDIVSMEGILINVNVDLITNTYSITKEPAVYITYDNVITYPATATYNGIAKMEEAMYGVNRRAEWTSDKALTNLIKTAEDKANKDGLTLLNIKYNYYPGDLVHHFDLATVYVSPIKDVGNENQLEEDQLELDTMSSNIVSLQIPWIQLLTLLFWIVIAYLVYKIITAVRDIVMKGGGSILLIIAVAYLIGKIMPLLPKSMKGTKEGAKELYPARG